MSEGAGKEQAFGKSEIRLASINWHVSDEFGLNPESEASSKNAFVDDDSLKIFIQSPPAL